MLINEYGVEPDHLTVPVRPTTSLVSHQSMTDLLGAALGAYCRPSAYAPTEPGAPRVAESDASISVIASDVATAPNGDDGRSAHVDAA